MRKNTVKGYLFAILSAVIYGTMPLMAKYIYADGVTPHTLVFFRNLFAVIPLGILAYSEKKTLSMKPKLLPRVSLISLLGCCATPMLLFSSYGRSILKIFSIWQEMVKDSENLLFKEEFQWRGHTGIAAGRIQNGNCVCVCVLGLTSKNGKFEITPEVCALLGMGTEPEFAEKFKALIRTAE